MRLRDQNVTSTVITKLLYTELTPVLERKCGRSHINVSASYSDNYTRHEMITSTQCIIATVIRNDTKRDISSVRLMSAT